MSLSLRRQLQTAEQIAQEAGQLLMRHQRRDIEIEHKDGWEPVTDADREANELIVTRLTDAFPGDAILAEESADRSVSKSAGRIWIVDPMDGTHEFTQRRDEFAVMIGLAEAGRPVLGVVNQPAAGMLYRGIVGCAAELVCEGVVTALGVTTTATSSQLRLIVSRSHTPKVVRQMASHLGIRNFIRSGSVGVKIGKLARGICDLYLHPASGTKLWDTCAPEAILVAAGGQMSDFDGQPLAYDPEHRINSRGIVASNGADHAGLVERLQGFFP